MSQNIVDDVRVNVTEKAGCRIEMDVSVGSDMVKQGRNLAVKSVAKEVSIPGFRTGKAPSDLILKKYGAAVEQKLHKAVADLAFIAAQKNAKIPLLNNNAPISFDMKKINEDGAEMTFSFETEPKVPNVDASLFERKEVTRSEVGEKQIEEAIRQMRFFYAQWKPVEDRDVQDGDYIMIDLSTFDGEVEQKVFHHIRFEVSKERMAGWMKKMVVGARSGAVLEGMSEADEGAEGEFEPKKVRLTLLKVEEAVLPELDDAFAQKVGAKDVAHMRQSIEDLLKKQVEEKAQSDLREQVSEFLSTQYVFELPQSLIDTEQKHRLNQMQHDPKFKANWNKMSQEERKELQEKVASESAQAVRLFYLSRQIVQNEKLPVTHQEVQNEAIAIYQSHSGRNAQIDKMPKEVYALALSRIMLAKAQDFVLEYKKA